MDKKYDVVALGELLIDFTQNGISDNGNPLFEANPGGAPCNVLAMLKKLGKSCAFIGKVGDDMFGVSLRDTVKSIGIDTSALLMDRDVRTTLAFVQTFENGDRDFSFYRNPGADMMLTADEIPEDMIKNAKVFHFGTLSMTHDAVREATKKAVRLAKENGALISFDPNLRPPLWDSLENAAEQIKWGLAQCDILKIADNEIEFISGSKDFDEGAAYLQKNFPNIRLLNVTAGADGSYSYYSGKKVFVPSFKLGGTIETTGAGDTFCACVLYHVLKFGWHGYSEDELKEMLTFANAAASIITTRKGALYVMPEMEEIQAMINNH
jgi:fructokinase